MNKQFNINVSNFELLTDNEIIKEFITKLGIINTARVYELLREYFKQEEQLANDYQ